MILRIAAITVCLLISAFPAAAQEDLVSISARVSPSALSAGQTARLVLTVKVAQNFHINSNNPQTDFIPTVLEITGAEGLKMSQPVYPQPHLKKVSFAPQPVELFSGSFDIKLELTAPKAAQPGKRDLNIMLSYQACDDQMCMMPSAVEGKAVVEVK